MTDHAIGDRFNRDIVECKDIPVRMLFISH